MERKERKGETKCRQKKGRNSKKGKQMGKTNKRKKGIKKGLGRKKREERMTRINGRGGKRTEKKIKEN